MRASEPSLSWTCFFAAFEDGSSTPTPVGPRLRLCKPSSARAVGLCATRQRDGSPAPAPPRVGRTDGPLFWLYKPWSACAVGLCAARRRDGSSCPGTLMCGSRRWAAPLAVQALERVRGRVVCNPAARRIILPRHLYVRVAPMGRTSGCTSPGARARSGCVQPGGATDHLAPAPPCVGRAVGPRLGAAQALRRVRDKSPLGLCEGRVCFASATGFLVHALGLWAYTVPHSGSKRARKSIARAEVHGRRLRWAKH